MSLPLVVPGGLSLYICSSCDEVLEGHSKWKDISDAAITACDHPLRQLYSVIHDIQYDILTHLPNFSLVVAALVEECAGSETVGEKVERLATRIQKGKEREKSILARVASGRRTGGGKEEGGGGVEDGGLSQQDRKELSARKAQRAKAEDMKRDLESLPRDVPSQYTRFLLLPAQEREARIQKAMKYIEVLSALFDNMDLAVKKVNTLAANNKTEKLLKQNLLWALQNFLRDRLPKFRLGQRQCKEMQLWHRKTDLYQQKAALLDRGNSSVSVKENETTKKQKQMKKQKSPVSQNSVRDEKSGRGEDVHSRVGHGVGNEKRTSGIDGYGNVSDCIQKGSNSAEKLSIESVHPTLCPLEGAGVTITGTGFGEGTEVYINGKLCDCLLMEAGAENTGRGRSTSLERGGSGGRQQANLYVVTPRVSAPANVGLKVCNPDGQEAELPNVLFYADLEGTGSGQSKRDNNRGNKDMNGGGREAATTKGRRREWGSSAGYQDDRAQAHASGTPSLPTAAASLSSSTQASTRRADSRRRREWQTPRGQEGSSSHSIPGTAPGPLSNLSPTPHQSVSRTASGSASSSDPRREVELSPLSTLSSHSSSPSLSSSSLFGGSSGQARSQEVRKDGNDEPKSFLSSASTRRRVDNYTPAERDVLNVAMVEPAVVPLSGSVIVVSETLLFVNC